MSIVNETDKKKTENNRDKIKINLQYHFSNIKKIFLKDRINQRQNKLE